MDTVTRQSNSDKKSSTERRFHMTRSQRNKRHEIKEAFERKKLFGGSGDITMPHSDTSRFDPVLYKNSLKKKG